ncbi:MAG: hypothetical protein IPM53_18540 [Anaerolineaceae bacterium]|nr:hypothetical protein [Anaerolineaceae bacterium]
MANSIIQVKEQTAVLVITQNRLLGDVLEFLLSAAVDLYAYQISPASFDHDRLFEFIDLHRPPVIILEQGTLNEISVTNHLVKYGRTRLILVNTQSNQIRIHDHSPVLLTQAVDLTSLLLIPS